MQHIKHLSRHTSITMRIDTIQTHDTSIQMRVQVAKWCKNTLPSQNSCAKANHTHSLTSLSRYIEH